MSLVAVPEAMASTLGGLYDVFNCFGALGWFDEALAAHPPFDVEIVAPERAPVMTASGLPFPGQRSLDEVERTQIVIVPSTMVENGEWRTGRHPAVVDWLRKMHARGAVLGSACSGTFLLAETGLLDGREATLHWAYGRTFRENFPTVRLRLEEALVVSGGRHELVMSGAATSWHELALYLIARELGPSVAQAVAKFYAFQWHTEGLGPYVVFEPPTDHDDAVVRSVQNWLNEHLTTEYPVKTMVDRSGLPERTFKRRFKAATGHSVIDYVQRLRVEEAKSRLERTDEPVDEIAWSIGYEEPAFFRRLFKRVAGIPPGTYRRKFRIPEPRVARQ